jgi:hypothetical protein
VVQRDQLSAYLAFCVPAIAEYGPVEVMILMEDGEPVFRVSVAPWNPDGREGSLARQFSAALRRLNTAGFERHGMAWMKDHSISEWLDDEDVPGRLIELAEPDLAQVVESRVLDLDVELGMTKARRDAPPRLRRIPKDPD